MDSPTYRRLSTEPFKPEPDDDMIVCRCEEVTKGEIRRFTRCAMGLCQGRTCTKLIQGIAAREMACTPADLLHPASRSPQRPLQMQELGNERF